jgi:hypothetical protein
MPSLPSGDTRISAMRFAVSALSDLIDLPASHRANQVLDLHVRLGPPASRCFNRSSMADSDWRQALGPISGPMRRASSAPNTSAVGSAPRHALADQRG